MELFHDLRFFAVFLDSFLSLFVIVFDECKVEESRIFVPFLHDFSDMFRKLLRESFVVLPPRLLFEPCVVCFLVETQPKERVVSKGEEQMKLIVHLVGIFFFLCVL
jgi:hypothetical protein